MDSIIFKTLANAEGTNLPYLGAFKIVVDVVDISLLTDLSFQYGAIGTYHIKSDKVIQLTNADGDVLFSGTDISFTSTTVNQLFRVKFLETGYHYLSFFDKYSIISISCNRFYDISEFSFLTNAKSITLTGSPSLNYIDIDKINAPLVTAIGMYNGVAVGNLSSVIRNQNMRLLSFEGNSSDRMVKGDLSTLIGLTNLTYLNIPYNDITGNIETLSALTKCNVLGLNNNVNMTGELCNLLEALWNNGKRSATVTCNIGGTLCTINGVIAPLLVVTAKFAADASGSYLIQVTYGSTTIAYNGTSWV